MASPDELLPIDGLAAAGGIAGADLDHLSPAHVGEG
jgi:hypothetical protein